MSGKIYKVEVRIESREDGGLRVWSPDVPGFRLSHSDRNAVFDDIIPALEGVLGAQMNGQVTVREISSISEIGRQEQPAENLPLRKEYGAEQRAA